MKADRRTDEINRKLLCNSRLFVYSLHAEASTITQNWFCNHFWSGLCRIVCWEPKYGNCRVNNSFSRQEKVCPLISLKQVHWSSHPNIVITPQFVMNYCGPLRVLRNVHSRTSVSWSWVTSECVCFGWLFRSWGCFRDWRFRCYEFVSLSTILFRFSGFQLEKILRRCAQHSKTHKIVPVTRVVEGMELKWAFCNRISICRNNTQQQRLLIQKMGVKSTVVQNRKTALKTWTNSKGNNNKKVRHPQKNSIESFASHSLCYIGSNRKVVRITYYQDEKLINSLITSRRSSFKGS